MARMARIVGIVTARARVLNGHCIVFEESVLVCWDWSELVDIEVILNGGMGGMLMVVICLMLTVSVIEMRKTPSVGYSQPSRVGGS